MKATVLHAPHDVRLDDVEDPVILAPTDAIVRVVATCVCGSDLWNYRGINEFSEPRPIGHEMVGVVEEVGRHVAGMRPGDFVISPFTISDNSCPHCLMGMQTACENLTYFGGTDREGLPMGGAQAEYVRVPLADGTLVPLPETPDAHQIPSLLTLADVMGTGWHAAICAGVHEGDTVCVVGDGAVGLLGVLAARQMGAERIIAMSRHPARQALAVRFGATDIVEERGDEGAERIRELTSGVGADAVLECVGTGDSMEQAMSCARPGAMVGFVGVPHGVRLPVELMFRRNIGLAGGMAPVRQYLPALRDDVLDGVIEPGLVFDLELPLEEVAAGYAAMDERRAVKCLLHV
ncbi:Threonine dehydrogenase [Austwickia chelonae]|uniref:Putative zinc-containing alcohol dehydrogenase n=1 Tax=Austwickia chelonae NBRC 105200 TaxID=1184607 RepID=K6VUL0_9MICO|nr:zinc-dependent alcohol dehydrogenase family protein [Austwickia chelonae]GAB78990.1 putative zinc-containing alcohol dehydrogenase [Austwickia chelonae NBRC 105200]SEV87899.1 Threonine dehydrogenase [Austwickia chelonae]